MKIHTLIFILLISSFMTTNNKFTFKTFLDNFCKKDDEENEHYKIQIQGTISDPTEVKTTWTPTFESPKNPTVTCTMEPTDTENLATIDWKITSPINKEDVILTKLTVNGFDDLTWWK